jgi:hypothetical protein
MEQDFRFASCRTARRIGVQGPCLRIGRDAARFVSLPTTFRHDSGEPRLGLHSVQRGREEDTMTRLFGGLLSYLVAAVGVAGGAAALLFYAMQSMAAVAPTRQAAARETAPRIQVWLDRKAESADYAAREEAAARAERERAEALRIKIPSAAEYADRARALDTEQQQARRRERAMMEAKEQARREARRRAREPARPDVQAAFGYAPEPRWSSYPDQLRPRSDRGGD